MSLQNRVEDVYSNTKSTIEKKIETICEKIGDDIEEGKPGAHVAAVAIGVAQLSYGLVRGGLALSGVLGHGIAGYASRHGNRTVAKKIVENGLEAAGENIEGGIETIVGAVHHWFKPNG